MASVWNLLHVIRLSPRSLRWLLKFWKICAPLDKYPYNLTPCLDTDVTSLSDQAFYTYIQWDIRELSFLNLGQVVTPPD